MALLHNLDEIQKLIPDMKAIDTDLYPLRNNIEVIFTDDQKKPRFIKVDSNGVMEEEIESKAVTNMKMQGLSKVGMEKVYEIVMMCDHERIFEVRKRDIFDYIEKFGGGLWGEYFKVLREAGLVLSKRELLSKGMKWDFANCKTLFVRQTVLYGKKAHIIAYNPRFILEQAIVTFMTYRNAFKDLFRAYVYVCMFMFYHELGHINLLHLVAKKEDEHSTWKGMSEATKINAMEVAVNSMVRKFMNEDIWNATRMRHKSFVLNGDAPDVRIANGIIEGVGYTVTVKDKYIGKDVADLINEYIWALNKFVEAFGGTYRIDLIKDTGKKLGKKRVMIRIGIDMDYIFELVGGVNSPIIGRLLDGFIENIKDKNIDAATIDLEEPDEFDVIKVKSTGDYAVILAIDKAKGSATVVTAKDRNEATRLAARLILDREMEEKSQSGAVI